MVHIKNPFSVLIAQATEMVNGQPAQRSFKILCFLHTHHHQKNIESVFPTSLISNDF